MMLESTFVPLIPYDSGTDCALASGDGSISELVSSLKTTFHQQDFIRVERVLIDRDRKKNLKIENLERDIISLRKALRFEYAKKIYFEEEFRKYEVECGELRQRDALLAEEKKLASQRMENLERKCEELLNNVSDLKKENLELQQWKEMAQNQLLEFQKKYEEFQLRVSNIQEESSNFMRNPLVGLGIKTSSDDDQMNKMKSGYGHGGNSTAEDVRNHNVRGKDLVGSKPVVGNERSQSRVVEIVSDADDEQVLEEKATNGRKRKQSNSDMQIVDDWGHANGCDFDFTTPGHFPVSACSKTRAGKWIFAEASDRANSLDRVREDLAEKSAKLVRELLEEEASWSE